MLELTRTNHEAIIKEAFVGAVARAGLSLGKTMLRNPLKTLGVVGTAYDMGSAGSKLRKSVAMRPNALTTPTNF